MSDGIPTAQEQRGWATSESLEFYRAKRANVADLYDSEREFLPPLLPQVASVLDVGCATGGFSRIMRAFNPRLRYIGVDVIPEFIRQAQRDYPESEFHVTDGIGFPPEVPPIVDLVHSSGVLHVNTHHAKMLAEMWARAGRYLLCDFRLTSGPSVQGTIRLPGGSELPYFVLNAAEQLSILKSLDPAPTRITIRGYVHPPSSRATLPVTAVTMAFFLLEKGDGSGEPVINGLEYLPI
jgi:SAM-dependent methyltransferase